MRWCLSRNRYDSIFWQGEPIIRIHLLSPSGWLNGPLNVCTWIKEVHDFHSDLTVPSGSLAIAFSASRLLRYMPPFFYSQRRGKLMVPPLISLRNKWPIFYLKLKYGSQKKTVGWDFRTPFTPWRALRKYLYIRWSRCSQRYIRRYV